MIRNNSLSEPHVSVGEEASVPRADIHHVYLSAGALQTFLQRRRKITAGATKTISGEMEEARMRLQLVWQSPSNPSHPHILSVQPGKHPDDHRMLLGRNRKWNIRTKTGSRVLQLLLDSRPGTAEDDRKWREEGEAGRRRWGTTGMRVFFFFKWCHNVWRFSVI